MPRKNNKNIEVKNYSHDKEKRKNNPHVGLVSSETDKVDGGKSKYAHDPHIDPYLSWAGKKEGTEFEDTGTSIVVTFRKLKLEEYDLNELTERQVKAIDYLARHGKITSQKYISLTNVGERTARNDLSAMVNKGLLQKKGKTQGSYYIIRQ